MATMTMERPAVKVTRRKIVNPQLRLNKKNVYDSVCLGCFNTIASARTEAELEAYERLHVCTKRSFLHTI